MTRVLLVEDDLLLGREQARLLSESGFKVDHARHAGEALAAIDAELPDVIIVDMLLPVTSGMALLHELQSYGDTAKIPAIVCSSMADNFSLDELRPYGVVRMIDKATMIPADIVTAVRALSHEV